MKWLYLLLVPCLLQGCATQKREVYFPRIAEQVNGWAVDAAGWISYRTTMFGPRLSVHFTPVVSSENNIISIESIWINSHREEFKLAVRSVFLDHNGRIYEARGHQCGRSKKTGDNVSIFVIPAETHQVPACIVLSFNLSQPINSEPFVLLITLHHVDRHISVPRLIFKKTMRSIAGSFS